MPLLSFGSAYESEKSCKWYISTDLRQLAQHLLAKQDYALLHKQAEDIYGRIGGGERQQQ